MEEAMIASILTIPRTPDAKGDDLFQRFTKTPGVHHAYQLEPMEGGAEVVVVSIWESAEARDAYMKGPLMQEVNQFAEGQSRKVYRVRNSI